MQPLEIMGELGFFWKPDLAMAELAIQKCNIF
jgi:hypothetical protein